MALVIEGLPAPNTDAGGRALQQIVVALRNLPGISGVVSYGELRDPIFLGQGGGTFVLVGLSSINGPVELLVPQLHQLEHSLEDQLRPQYPSVKIRLTGETALARSWIARGSSRCCWSPLEAWWRR